MIDLAAGTYILTVTQSMVNYPNVKATRDFNLVVSNCVLTSLSITASSVAQTHYLRGVTVKTSWVFDFSNSVQGGDCSYEVKYWVSTSTNPAPSFVTVSGN